MVFDEQGVFELLWKNSGTTKLSTADELNYYTLFWCENVNRHPYQCNVRKLIYRIINYRTISTQVAVEIRF